MKVGSRILLFCLQEFRKLKEEDNNLGFFFQFVFVKKNEYGSVTLV